MGSKKEQIKNFFSLLLSHHTEEYYNRTFTLSFRGKEVHFCARCSGVILGFIGGLLVTLFINFDIQPFYALIGAVGLAIPATIDWGTQKLGYRESINPIRFISGLLLGMGIVSLQYTYEIYWLTLIVIGIFLVIFFIISINGY